MDEHRQWKKVTHRLTMAAARLAEAEALLDEIPNTGHISLAHVRKTTERLRSLATDKVEATKDQKVRKTPWKKEDVK